MGAKNLSEILPNQQSASIVLLARSGRFFVYEPGLGVIASAETVDGAYEKFDGIRRQHLEEVESAGLAARRSPSGPSKQSIGRELGIFSAKVCIVLLVLAAILVPAISGMGRAIEQTANTISNRLSSTGSLSLNDVVQKATDIAKDAQDLSPERKETLRQSLEVISRELRPFVDAWRNPPNPPSVLQGNPSGPQK